ncbi:cupin domain-containing protein [Spongiibacter sp. KMU-158]|uniref:Cupin domain-containing protein n=1 Tax=Spongiibacter pelagi TaxID=2760804 RepID=A0A927BYX5_9GAMM|nr:ChrR family anti-sigma-E factor [Spongiibacter pelagi]MBD2858120.1 cupin domain-containing protein [Spongiibacter pelagi]
MSKIAHHPESETLAAYASGSLSAALGIVIGSHLEMCAVCRAEVARLESVGGSLIDRLTPAPISAARREQIFAQLDAGLGESAEPLSAAPVTQPTSQLPTPLRHFFAVETYDQLPWRWIGPGVRLLSIDCGEGKLVMLNIGAGRKMPVHSHRGNELTMILQGGYSDALGHFDVGDVADLDSRVEHQPVADADINCICVAGLDDKLQFKGWLARMLQPFVGL